MTRQQHLADLIRTYMRVHGLSQAEAARACKFTESQMSSLLTRERRTWPDPETVVKLHKGLGIPVAETMDACARDIGVGPLGTTDLGIDADVRATAQIIADLPATERRTLDAIIRAFIQPDIGDDKK